MSHDPPPHGGRPHARADTPPRTLERVRKEAKAWLHALERDDVAAQERLARALGPVERPATLRQVQHALARECGFEGWSALRASIARDALARATAMEAFEEKAQALLDAYRSGTSEAMERHYRHTWHRRAWSGMRTYVQLDLGKRPSAIDADIDITIDDARLLVAREHGFASWEALRASTAARSGEALVTAAPVIVREGSDEDAHELIATRDWSVVMRTLERHEGAVLDARGQMTDEMLAQVAGMSRITSLQLGNCKSLTDAGVRHLARMPQLQHLDLSQTAVSDRGLEVLAALPQLESLSLVMTAVTDDGLAHVRHCEAMRRLNLMWTRTGDGAIRALAGKGALTHFLSGSRVTDRGLAALHDLPVFARWHGGEPDASLLSGEGSPNHLVLRGAMTDAGMRALQGLDGLASLTLADTETPLSWRAVPPLALLPRLGWLSVDAADDWMPHLAALPVLRHLSIQDTTAGDDGFTALSASTSIERLWGRRCHNLRSRGFLALSRMPRLQALSVSCLNVDDSAIAALPEFPMLRELMPMDIPDVGYRHIARCRDLEVLTLMYCRDTTDAATEHIRELTRLRRYFNSYTTITDRTPLLLSEVQSLESVTFDACHELTDAGVAALARLPALREVRLSGRGLSPAVKQHFGAAVRVRYSL